jgi:hypothetical protein
MMGTAMVGNQHGHPPTTPEFLNIGQDRKFLPSGAVDRSAPTAAAIEA